MAYTLIKPIRIGELNVAQAVPVADRFTTVPVAGGKFYWNNNDRRTIVEVDNTTGSSDLTVTIKGNNKYTVSIDLVATVKKGTSALVQCNSEFYMQMKGEDKGYMIIVPSAEAKISVIMLA